MNDTKLLLLANLMAPEKIAEDDQCYNLLTKLYHKVFDLRLQRELRARKKKGTKCQT